VLYPRPVVDVAVAPPAVAAQVSLGGPGWGVHAMVGAPAAPVVVAPPPPPGPAVQVGVGINVGVGVGVGVAAPMVVAPGGVVYEERHGHHDHGRHVGWGPHVERHHGRPDRFVAGPAPVRGPLFHRGRGPAPARATGHGSVVNPRTQPGPGPGNSGRGRRH
jgi:hypothetical protein